MLQLDTLLSRARNGEKDAWDILLGRLRPLIWALCRRQVRDEADASSVTQDVLCRMHIGFERFRGTDVPQLLAWMRKIAARALIDRAREVFPTVSPLPSDVPGSMPVAGAELMLAEEMARVTAALESLPEPYRSVAVARLLHRQTSAVIARQMERSEVWVRVTCMRALRILRQELEKA